MKATGQHKKEQAILEEIKKYGQSRVTRTYHRTIEPGSIEGISTFGDIAIGDPIVERYLCSKSVSRARRSITVKRSDIYRDTADGLSKRSKLNEYPTTLA